MWKISFLIIGVNIVIMIILMIGLVVNILFKIIWFLGVCFMISFVNMLFNLIRINRFIIVNIGCVGCDKLVMIGVWWW